MSTHRADKRRTHQVGSRAVAQTGDPGRRRAPRAPRRVTQMASPSLIGGLALVVAAVGAASAGQAISAGQDASLASTKHVGAYVATLSGVSNSGRNAAKVSRSGVRAPATGNLSATAAAKRLAEKRTDKLDTAASEAEKYAQKLEKERLTRLRNAAKEARVHAQELQSDEWVLPTSGFHISTWFGEAGPYWSSGYHTGIDFATAHGTPAVAVANGVVVETGWDGAYGNEVRVRLENGDEVWYAHLSSIDIYSGQALVKGQQVGRVGDTGNSYGAHLHFEYRLTSNLSDGIDPRPYFLEHGIVL